VTATERRTGSQNKMLWTSADIKLEYKRQQKSCVNARYARRMVLKHEKVSVKERAKRRQRESANRGCCVGASVVLVLLKKGWLRH